MNFRGKAGRSLAMASVVFLLAGFASGCHNNGINTAIVVTLAPTAVTLALQGTQLFTASVANATDTTVTWQVNKITGGSATCGTISANGLYTAPSVLPSSSACGTITITAISNQDTKATATATVTLTSSITIAIVPTGMLTVGTNETESFVATVSGSGTNFVNTVNWLVNGTLGGSSTSGTICMIGTGPGLTVGPGTTVACVTSTPGDGKPSSAAIYYAPGTALSAAVTVTGQSVADNTQTASATVTVVASVVPTLTSISPSSVPQGAIFQDLYLTGTNFLSTTSVSVSGTVLTDVTRVSSTVLSARIPSNLLTSAGPLAVAAADQMGDSAGPSQTLTVTPVRPVALSILPSTFAQQAPNSSGASTIEVDGGYYTPLSSLAYNGSTKASSLVNNPATNLPDPRRISATIGGIASDLTTAGLFPVSVTTSNANPPQTVGDVTVRPTATPVITNTITSQISTPIALAYDEVLGTAVVLNQGTNNLALLDPAFTTVTSTITVSTSASSLLTGVAVDSLQHVALVVDNGGQAVQAVDLVGQALLGAALSIPAGQGPPYAVGVDNVHKIALVVGQNATAATLLDTSALSPASGPTILGTVPVATGAKPQVTVLPELGWALVAPGGAGGITVVDLVRSKIQQQGVIVFTAFLSPTVQSIALDSETKTVLLADPTVTATSIFRLTDQSVAGVNLGFGNSSSAVNSLTGIGLVANPGSQQAFVLDMSTAAKLATLPLTNKTQTSLALVFAQGPNKALMADDLDNSVTVIDFGPTRATGGDPQILQVSCPAAPPTVNSGCPVVIIAPPAAAVPLTVIGAGFTPNAQIRLNQTGSPTVTTNFVNSHLLTTMIPAAFLNSGPSRILVDVENPATGGLSNVKNIYVLQAVPVGAAPAGVAVDPQRDLAVVADSGNNAVSVVDINPSSPTFATVTSTLSVGSSPVGVGILARAGRVVVANSGDGTASVLDVTTNPPTLAYQVSIGAQPAGVAVDQGLGTALITSSGSNTINTFSMTATSAPQPSATASASTPVAAAIAPDLELAAVASETSGIVQILDVSSGSASLITQVNSVNQPVGVDYDPVNHVFLVLAEASNDVLTIDPTTSPPTLGSVRVGVDPTSLAYNFQSSTLLTLNSASNTLSVVDLLHSSVVDVLPLSGGPQYAVAIHPRLGLAVISDSANNQILLMPVPR